MERASRIFYDYVQNYAPELVSPQYEDFFKSAQDSIAARSQNKKPLNLDEMHDKISLGSLSQSLIGSEVVDSRSVGDICLFMTRSCLALRQSVRHRDALGYLGHVWCVGV